MKMTDLNKRARELLLQYETAKKALATERSDATDLIAEIKSIKEAQAVLQTIAQTVQQQAHKQIAHIVSRCIAMVFEQPILLEIDFRRARGKTEARLQFKHAGSGLVLEEPMEESGGGLIDVAAFAMRLAALMLSRPAARRLVILDEPFKFVSAEYLPNVRTMLQTLAKEMKIQFVMVTHIEELQVGTIIRIEK